MSITIVTAFFDIGRGDWSQEKGHPCYLQRSTDKYFKYFANLAQLNNPMVVFTDKENIQKIRDIRGSKSTTIIEIDINEKFKIYKHQIEDIQKSEKFRNKIPEKQLKNPEYWSPEYVLVTNLKAYFVKNAIKHQDVNTPLVAWVDFGYCRDIEIFNGISEWNYSFSLDKVHLFTIKKEFRITKENVLFSIANNKVFCIGGVIVASKEKWIDFSNLVLSCQKKLIADEIIDDDQGVYLMALLEQPDLFKLNYLGKNKWFDVFKKYDQSSKLSCVDQFKKLIGRY
jgi:protein YibB